MSANISDLFVFVSILSRDINLLLFTSNSDVTVGLINFYWECTTLTSKEIPHLFHIQHFDNSWASKFAHSR
jgi:hypothetical protein